ncbi:MAG TPA: hypothetical protein VEQ11_09370 [Chloroflexota bacterium]|nr:hypothetical protein [Chloroflexota bacterium]
MREQRTDSVLPAQSPPWGASPAERTLRGRLAAYTLHAGRDARQTTANGRAAFLARFETEVDPEGLLDPAERCRRAEQARRAYFTRLSLAALAARRARRAARGGGEVA